MLRLAGGFPHRHLCTVVVFLPCFATASNESYELLDSRLDASGTFHTVLIHTLGCTGDPAVTLSSFISSSFFQILRLDIPLLDLIKLFILITSLYSFQIPLESCFPSHTHIIIAIFHSIPLWKPGKCYSWAVLSKKRTCLCPSQYLGILK